MAKAQRQIISHIPHKGRTGEQWGLAIGRELMEMWMAKLSKRERDALPRDPQGLLIIDKVSSQLSAKLDEIVLDQAIALGWRIGLSLLVQWRFSEWDHEKHGPEKFEKLGRAFARSARVLQRRELPPIKDPDQWLVKKETVEELRVVLERLRASFALRRSTPVPAEAHDLFSSTVRESANLFPHLAANLERWQAFHGSNPEELVPLTVSSRPKPGALYDSFLSWCTGWDAESLRQAISRLGNAKL